MKGMTVSPFRKAKAEQAAIKCGIYGPSGSGKTFTSLLFAEGLTRLAGGRCAFVDTERGTDWYAKTVPDRSVHPEAFDFDAIYTRSLTETTSAIKQLNPKEHTVIVIDSITHLWEAARAAFSGKLTKVGTIPFTGWAQIKRPYKELINLLLNCPQHVFICGRQGNEFAEDESGELKRVGVKMKAEGETPYEPHILLRMEAVRRGQGQAIITAFAEKDRTGVLAGKTFSTPTYVSVMQPIVKLLGGTQAQMPDEDATAATDAEALTEQEAGRDRMSKKLYESFVARITLADSADELAAVGTEITPELKKRLTTAHVAELRECYLEAQSRLGKPAAKPKANKPPPATESEAAMELQAPIEPPEPEVPAQAATGPPVVDVTPIGLNSDLCIQITNVYNSLTVKERGQFRANWKLPSIKDVAKWTPDKALEALGTLEDAQPAEVKT